METSLDMNVDDVKWSIACASKRVSKITRGISDELSMSTAKVRHLLNNICSSTRNLSFLEVGTWFGGSFASAMYQNDGNFFTIDNFSQFDEMDSKTILHGKDARTSKRKIIHEIIHDYGNGNAVFFEEDALKFDTSRLPPINVFFCDPEHTYDVTKNCILRFSSIMKDRSVLIVDDYFLNDEVIPATIDGIREAEWVVEYDWKIWSGKIEDMDEWRNGLYVALLRRNR